MVKAARMAKTGATISTRTISLRLLRKDRKIADSVRDNRELTEHPTRTGRLFYEQSKDTPPPWLELINQFSADGPLKLRNKSYAAILFLDVVSDSGARTFALAFGGGHLALHADAFERNFGLKGGAQFHRPGGPQES